MILVCGEALIDLFIGPATSAGLAAEAVAGGSPFNVAVGIGQLGRPAAFLSTLSEDAFGEFLAGRLTAAGVASTYLHRCTNRTTLSVVATGSAGEPQYSFYAPDSADRALTVQDLPSELPLEVNAITAGSYSLGVEPIASAVETLLHREAGSRVISLDPNVRPRVVGDLNLFRQRFERLLASATIVKASSEDMEMLYPEADPLKIAREWMKRGVSLVIITRGSDGPFAAFQHKVVERPAPRVDVVDTVGAGDTFHAALLSWFDAESLLSRDRIAALTEEQITAALDFAAAAAAIVCTRRGADPPTWKEVIRFMNQSPHRSH